ncbi:hypothetical protein [Nostoc sp.]|uniref:hypothetical protein n=1 Tax=Nostoc sp. TaxID=1180 RepID=UPI00359343EF
MKLSKEQLDQLKAYETAEQTIHNMKVNVTLTLEGILLKNIDLHSLSIAVKEEQMAERTWTFELDDHRHVVEIEHGGPLGTRVIQVDGQMVEDSSKFWDTGSSYPFTIGEHECVLTIERQLINYQYRLSVDGREIV